MVQAVCWAEEVNLATTLSTGAPLVLLAMTEARGSFDHSVRFGSVRYTAASWVWVSEPKADSYCADLLHEG